MKTAIPKALNAVEDTVSTISVPQVTVKQSSSTNERAEDGHLSSEVAITIFIVLYRSSRHQTNKTLYPSFRCSCNTAKNLCSSIDKLQTTLIYLAYCPKSDAEIQIPVNYLLFITSYHITLTNTQMYTHKCQFNGYFPNRTKPMVSQLYLNSLPPPVHLLETNQNGSVA